ncbi:unnamed protein product [Coccothraustes coccothraustes]
MPAVKSGALPVEMLLPIAETMGLSCPALATLTFLPWLGIIPWSRSPSSSLGRADPSVPSPGKLCCLRTGMGPEAMSCKETGDVFSVGQESTHDVSHESDGKDGSGVT